MPVLLAGSSLPIPVTAGQTLVLKELTGTATVAGGSASREDATSRIGAGFYVYGPQGSDGTLTLSTTGIVEWQVVSGDATPADQPVLFDPGNRGTSGPSLSGDAAGAVRGAIRALSSTTLLGDSGIAFGAPPNGSTGVGASGLYSNSHVMWANDYLASMGQGLDFVAFRAVGGKTVAEVIAQQLQPTLADPTEIAWLHVGGNSLNTSLGNVSLETYLAQMEQLISALSAGKNLVLVEDIAPANQATAPAGATARAATYPLANAGVQAICRKYANVVYLDSYQTLVDPASTTLDAKTGYMLSDGLHNATLGAQQKGYWDARKILAAACITPYRTPGPNLLPAFVGSGGTVTPGSGSITGTPPVGWNVTVSAGSASVVITQRQPDIVRLAITNAGGTPSTVFLQVADLAALGAAVGAGTTPLKGRLGFQVSGVVNAVRAPALVMRQNQGSNNFSWVTGSKETTVEPTPILPTTAFGGIRSSAPMPIGFSTTQMEFLLVAEVGATTGALTLDVYTPALTKLPA